MSVMDELKSRWKALAERFDAYSQRERALLAAAVIGGGMMLGMTLLVDPDFARARVAQKQADQAAQDLAAVQLQLNAVKVQLQADPDAGKRAEAATLQKEMTEVEESFRKLENGLVPPENMNAVLERLLARNASVKLISFKSLTPVNLADAVAEATKSAEGMAAPAPASKTSLPGLYKHGVELRLEGSYADLYGWLNQLESSPQKVLWGDVRFAVAEYPRAVLMLTIYTLNLEKSWLAI